MADATFSLLQYVGVFAIPVGCSLFAVVLLYIDVRAHYWREREREALYLAAVDSALSKGPPRKRPVAPFIVKPASDFWVDPAGIAFPRAA